MFASKILKKLGIDDAIGAFPVHGACGVWGILAAGLFDVDVGGFYFAGESNIFGTQCYGILAIIGWVCVLTFMFLSLARVLGVLRVPKDVEDNGLDVTYHFENAEEFPGGFFEKLACYDV